MVANFGPATVPVHLPTLGLEGAQMVRNRGAALTAATMTLPPFAYAWLTSDR